MWQSGRLHWSKRPKGDGFTAVRSSEEVAGVRMAWPAALSELPPDVTLGPDLAVVPCQVGDSAGGWASDGGVVSVMVVAVEPAVKGSGAAGF